MNNQENCAAGVMVIISKTTGYYWPLVAAEGKVVAIDGNLAAGRLKYVTVVT